MRNSVDDDVIASKRIGIMHDVITREGFEFSVYEVLCILDPWGEFSGLLLPKGRLRSRSANRRTVLGYNVLHWGTGKVLSSKVFASKVRAYYEGIGAIGFYRGLIDEGTADCA